VYLSLFWFSRASYHTILQTGWVKKYSELECSKKKSKEKSSLGEETDTASTIQRRGLFARLFRKKSSDTFTGTDNDSLTDKSHVTSPDGNKKPSPATLRRYILATTAVALVGCNLYLFVSR
jgi:hypothetical protein